MIAILILKSTLRIRVTSLLFGQSSCCIVLCALYTSRYDFISHNVDILRTFISPSQEDMGGIFLSSESLISQLAIQELT